MLKQVLRLAACLAVCVSMTSAASVNFVENWEDDQAGAIPGSPWYADPLMPAGGLSIISGEAYNHTWTPGVGYGTNGLLVNSAGFGGKDAGVQARLVPVGRWVEATDAAPLTFEYFAKSGYVKYAEWYFEISLGDVHAPRLVDVGTGNPLPNPIPVIALGKPMIESGVWTKDTCFFDGSAWWPVDHLNYNDVWQFFGMTLNSDTITIPSEGTVPRAYTGVFDRISIYTRDYTSSYYTVIDDVSVTGGTVVHALTVSPESGLLSLGEVGGPFDPQCKTYALTNVGSSPIDWTASKNQSWLDVAPASGTLAVGAAIDVNVCINASADALPLGTHTDQVVFTDAISGNVQNRSVQLYVGHADTFTELFITNNDLSNRTLTFTPDGSAHYYTACSTSATAFPVSPNEGTTVTISGDNFQKVTLAQGATVRLYGQAYSEFYVGANGYITFGSGDFNAVESLVSHFNRPRISALFTDLNPTQGQISWRQMMDRAVVTYTNVVETGTPGDNSFQIEMFYDGRIRMTWLGLSAPDGLVGLSRGTGIPPDYLPSDLSSYGSCPAGPHPADFDGDGDVDLSDFGHLQLCLTGPSVLVIQPFCGNADLDSDDDVDQVGMDRFLPCLMGPDLPIPVNCLPN